MFTLLIAFVHIYTTRRCYSKRKEKYWEHIKIPRCNNKNITKNSQSKIVKVSSLLFRFVFMNNTRRCYNRIKEKIMRKHYIPPYVITKNPTKTLLFVFVHKNNIWRSYNRTKEKWCKHITFLLCDNKNNTKSTQSRIVKVFPLLIAFVHINNTRRCYNKRKKSTGNTLQSLYVVKKTPRKALNQGLLKCSYYFLNVSIWITHRGVTIE